MMVLSGGVSAASDALGTEARTVAEQCRTHASFRPSALFGSFGSSAQRVGGRASAGNRRGNVSSLLICKLSRASFPDDASRRTRQRVPRRVVRSEHGELVASLKGRIRASRIDERRRSIKA